jgi:predicted deacylase
MMIGRVLSALSVAALAGGVVYAQGGEDGAPAVKDTPVLEAAKVSTKDEARAYGEQEFELADLNKDGKVTQLEYIGFVRGQLAARAKAAAGETSEEQVMLSEDKTHFVAAAEPPSDDTSLSGAVPAALFQALSGGEATVTRKILVKARLANFKQADADRDNTLDEIERQKFADLVWLRATT